MLKILNKNGVTLNSIASDLMTGKSYRYDNINGQEVFTEVDSESVKKRSRLPADIIKKMQETPSGIMIIIPCDKKCHLLGNWVPIERVLEIPIDSYLHRKCIHLPALLSKLSKLCSKDQYPCILAEVPITSNEKTGVIKVEFIGNQA